MTTETYQSDHPSIRLRVALKDVKGAEFRCHPLMTTP